MKKNNIQNSQSAEKGSRAVIGRNTISLIVRVFFHLSEIYFAFCNSVAPVHFGKHCRVRK